MQVCFCIFSVSSLPACGRLSFFLHRIVHVMVFLSALTVSALENYLEVGIILSSIKLKTLCQYFFNPKMDIPTTQEIIFFRFMICTIVLFFGVMYDIVLFIDLFFVCQTYAVIISKIYLFEMEK